LQGIRIHPTIGNRGLSANHSVRLSDEHDDYKWANIEEVKAGPLAAGLHNTLAKIA